MTMLHIENLHARVEEKEILKGISLEVKPGEVHAIMGPNGSGKSTLASVIAGRDNFEVTEGKVTLENQDLLDLDPEERAHAGVFLSFQYPVEIPGVSVTNSSKLPSTNRARLAVLKTCPPTRCSRRFAKKRPFLKLTASSYRVR